MTRLRDCVLAACDAVEGARDQLTELDSVAGDGDHGTTMTIAARNIRARLAAAPGATGSDLIRQVAMGVGSVGGAIGPIYATALLRIASRPPEQAVTVAELRACAEAAEEAVMGLGKAKPGDKTVLDALHPVVESLRASEAGGEDVAAAVAGAARAARAGAGETAGMIATLGRASRLGERSRGWADPGATSFAIAIEAIAAALGAPARG